ncbi:MAG: hypothetical protein II682_05675 [Firmicutes bacterium]|nr:hypothetical protein [Bacillota bacterium]MBQ3964913.1 hypothetical protein [Bacillota bacterium]
MEYVIGAIAGLIFGGIVAFLKGRFLWKKGFESDTPEQLGGVMARSAISFFINVVTLAVVFLARDLVPFHWIACLLGAALAMSVLNPLFIARYKPKDVSKD